MLFSSISAYAGEGVEIIAGLNEKTDLPVLNNELRKLDDKSKDIDARVVVLEAVPAATVADGQQVGYSYIQSSANTTSTSNTAVMDNSVPQVSELTLMLSKAHTPLSTTNILIIRGYTNTGVAANQAVVQAIAKDSDVATLKSNGGLSADPNSQTLPEVTHRMVAGTTSEITFKLYLGSSTAGTRMNGQVSTDFFDTAGSAYLEIFEIKAS